MATVEQLRAKIVRLQTLMMTVVDEPTRLAITGLITDAERDISDAPTPPASEPLLKF